jgi:hypothetical protein
MLSGEAHAGEHVGLGLVHQGSELGDLGSQLIGDAPPLCLGLIGVVLGEGGGDEGRDDAPATAAGVSQDVAHEVDAGVVEKVSED